MSSVNFLYFFNDFKASYHSFCSYLTIYKKNKLIMIQNKNYKRTSREMSKETRDKISAKLRGRKKSIAHRRAISKGLKKAWSCIGYGNTNNQM